MKRLFDLIFTVPGLIFLSPLFLVVAVWIRMDSSGPIFFQQNRVGRFGKIFKILKFRTMVINSEHLGHKITFGDDPRITNSGRFLRKYKLDELPQLFNVIKGEMSLVGPRPEVPEYVDVYPRELSTKVFSVRPGVTDLSSLEMINESDLLASSVDPLKTYVEEIIPRKLALCEEYIDNQSIFLDILIIIKTLWAVVGNSPNELHDDKSLLSRKLNPPQKENTQNSSSTES